MHTYIHPDLSHWKLRIIFPFPWLDVCWPPFIINTTCTFLISFLFFIYIIYLFAKEGHFYPQEIIMYFILIIYIYIFFFLLILLLLYLFWQVRMIIMENAEVLLQSDAVKLRAAHLKTRLETFSKQEIYIYIFVLLLFSTKFDIWPNIWAPLANMIKNGCEN